MSTDFFSRVGNITKEIKEAPQPQQNPSNPLQTQVGGNHYKIFKIQPIEFCMANNLNPCQHNVIKYILREKGSISDRLQDLEKAKHYIDLLAQFITQSEKGNSNV